MRRMAANKRQRKKQTRKRAEMRIEVLGGRFSLTLASWWWCSRAIRGSRSPSSDLASIIKSAPSSKIVQIQLKLHDKWKDEVSPKKVKVKRHLKIRISLSAFIF